ncbi:MAG: glycosyltransferase family 39 protein [Candidatus Omnitrophica bacterium]|nr:glycosyltransferase family 39 protein [Candidatus Omnitrophota bacterium]
MSFLNKNRKIILFLIILIGFALRFYPATRVPITWDEEKAIESVQNINFDYNNLQLPLVDKVSSPEEASPMASKYLVKLWWFVFGPSLLGTRLLLIIFSMFSVLIAYFLVKNTLGVKVALLSSLLLSISQFNVALARTISHDSIHIFFVVLSLFLFYRAFQKFDKNLVLLNGLIIGLGFWVKESMFFLIPIYFIFLLTQPDGKKWLKDKYLWISFGLALLIAAPLLIFELDSNLPRHGYFSQVASIGLSLNSLGFYLGELILVGIKWGTSLGFFHSLNQKLFPDPLSWAEGGGTFFENISDAMTRETPPVNFILGIIILVAVVKSIRNKNSLIRLLLVSFLFNFLAFCFIRKSDIIDGVWSLGALEWGVIGFFPGVILASDMLIKYLKKNTRKNFIFVGLIISFIFIRTLNMVVYPLACYFPTTEKCISDYFGDSDRFLKNGKMGLTKNTLRKIYQVTDNMQEYKIEAALRLSEILIKEGNREQAAEYLHYLILHDPEKGEIPELLEKLE